MKVAGAGGAAADEVAAADAAADREEPLMPTTKTAAEGTVTAFDEELAALARALSNPARVAIVRHLASTGTCVCGQIVDVMPLAQATVSQHLKVLKEAGLVQGEVDGPRTCYCLNPETMKRFQSLVASLPA
jgi:ArsR family transcriptional regulator